MVLCTYWLLSWVFSILLLGKSRVYLLVLTEHLYCQKNLFVGVISTLEDFLKQGLEVAHCSNPSIF